MIQVIFILILLVVAGISSIASLTFLLIAIIKWKNQKDYKYFIGLFALFGFFAVIAFNIDLTTVESTDRENSAHAFKDNFRFEPPPVIKEINYKNFVLHDASVHWMRFTYDSAVFEKIIINDQPLLIVIPNTKAHSKIINEFSKSNPNAPEWTVSPNSMTSEVYYKKDFLDHSFSEYYLWRSGNQMHMMVHYFD